MARLPSSYVYAPELSIFRWIGGPMNVMKTIIKDNIEQVR